ncbi:SRPBCC family protein [Nocardioides litoris]|uniref:SRPBCC family protein n=1 Tax=Nocardioides litoris TaxID=1926648 RepID=UPI00111DA303|nr:SRPBCC family protein [Nocardioides litoris]
MTFEHTATATTDADPPAVWTLWSDPSSWPGWDPSVVAVALDGPFAAGTTGTMTLAGPVDVPLELAVVETGRRYLDELRLGDLVIRIDHVVEPRAGGGSTITVTTTITGPGAADVGPMVTAEAPLALAALTAAAEAP